jgi:hypothetical protein
MDYFFITATGIDVFFGYQCLKLYKNLKNTRIKISKLEKNIEKEDHLYHLLTSDFPAYCKEVGISAS